MAEPKLSDNALRAVTDDGAFRVITVRTTDIVRRMLATGSLWGPEAVQLADLVTGTILVRETMAPTHRVQGLLRSADASCLWVGDSDPDGGARGLLTRKDKKAAASIKGGTLEVVRTLNNGELHRGMVQVPVGSTMSQALMAYLQESEQVVSMLAIGCVLGNDHVVAAGGYIVQLLPEVGQGPLAIMAERLRDFENIGPLLANLDAATTPLMNEILYGMPFTRLEESPLAWRCRCGRDRVLATLATLPRSDLVALSADEEPIELSCDFCGSKYAVSPAELRALLAEG
ncbi:MAG TPA: Hsp33 family molecular chaperone HslO [Polyangiaceae bacterium]|jgi:molecular chaperone Hsp33|nr:Hsp33 family molecular chaperone HslO [Polyangiaceae bacterium]